MLETLERERGLKKETLIDAVKAALLSACRRRFKTIDNLEVDISPDGIARIFAKKIVVTKVKDDSLEISLSEAKKIKEDVKKGEEIKIETTPTDFGRFAAQTAKQVIIQRIREAEKEGAYEEFSAKVSELVSGIIQRRERGGYLVNLGHAETLLPYSEIPMGEVYRPKDRIKIYITEVKKTPRGPIVVISRTHPGLVKKLFEAEVPEIREGVLEIKNISREAGRRSKIAIVSHDKNVGVVGTCVGHMGARIQNIVKELGVERVDIIEWSDNPANFIANSLSPAKVSKVILNEEERTAKVLLPSAQLSLAIGKEGQNVRLAAKLTGWKIDILSEEEEAKVIAPKTEEKIKVKEVSEELGIKSKELIEKLKEIGIEVKTAASTITLEEKKAIVKKIKGG